MKGLARPVDDRADAIGLGLGRVLAPQFPQPSRRQGRLFQREPAGVQDGGQIHLPVGDRLDPCARVQRGKRVLKNNLHVFAHFTQFFALQGQNIFPLIQHFARGRFD